MLAAKFRLLSGSYPDCFLTPFLHKLMIDAPPISKPNTTLITCPVLGTYHTLFKLRFEEEIGSAITQQSADAQQLGLPFPSYEEEDILNWDVAIATPPPRPSGTIRVKLKYTGRSKPIPVEDPWAE